MIIWARWLKWQGTRPWAGWLGSIPGGGDFSSLLLIQTGPGAQSASCKMRTGAFQKVKAEHRTNHLPLSSVVAVNMWTLVSTFPWAFMALIGDYVLYLYLIIV